MPQVHTEQFGTLDYQEDATLHFPRGLPGFDHAQRFVLIRQPELAPLVHLQSLESTELCFLAMPVQVIDPDYCPDVLAEDSEALGGADHGADTLLLALLAVSCEGQVTANLLAPVVINLATHKAVQAVRGDTRYSHAHSFTVAGEPLCS